MEDMIWFCLLRLSGNRGYMLICVLDLMFMQVEFQLNFLDSRISKQVFIKSPDAAQYPTVCEVVQHLDLYSSMCLVSALLLISKLVEMILLCCYSSPIC
ncbi:uncharacterized protein LOC126653722 isoform X3 [Mercurialis annua]|uniref:uncharacterized protein LOC126653722 isoform X3 n=1 Tax=Mercurialis annua TaxID=3986 RepID=UPI0024ACC1D2|nr:uncharacterized protein LOC126653722 isoform X3 [Mercurialis annua]